MGSYDLYRELELDPALTSEALGDFLDRRIAELLDEGLSPTSPEVDQLITGRAVLADPVKRDAYDAALEADDGQVTVTWLHLLADAPEVPSRARGTLAAFRRSEHEGEGGRDKRPQLFRTPIRVIELMLIFLGCLGAVLVAVFVDPTQQHASTVYLRVILGFLAYVVCIVTGTELIKAVRR